MRICLRMNYAFNAIKSDGSHALVLFVRLFPFLHADLQNTASWDVAPKQGDETLGVIFLGYDVIAA